MKTTSHFSALSAAAGALSLFAFATSSNAQSFFAVPGMTNAAHVSDDGKVIVGSQQSDSSNYSPAVWSAATGKIPLGPFPGETRFPRHVPSGISADGTVVVGTATWGTGSFGTRNEAFRWTANTGMVGIGHLAHDKSSEAAAVSADGKVVVGTSFTREPGSNLTREAIRWTADTGVVGLGALGGYGSESEASDVSADGSVVVGLSDGQVMRWTQDTGTQGIGVLGTGVKLSGNGEVIVGFGFNQEPFRWTEALGLIELGHPELTARSGGSINAVNADGTMILGSTIDGLNRVYPFIWSPTSGLRNLLPVLEDVFGLADELEGWGNLYAADMSADGRYFAGSGTNPAGQAQAWIIDLGTNFGPIPPGEDTPPPPYIRPVPEPATYGWIAVSGLAALIVCRRGKRPSLAVG